MQEERLYSRDDEVAKRIDHDTKRAQDSKTLSIWHCWDNLDPGILFEQGLLRSQCILDLWQLSKLTLNQAVMIYVATSDLRNGFPMIS